MFMSLCSHHLQVVALRRKVEEIAPRSADPTDQSVLRGAIDGHVSSVFDWGSNRVCRYERVRQADEIGSMSLEVCHPGYTQLRRSA